MALTALCSCRFNSRASGGGDCGAIDSACCANGSAGTASSDAADPERKTLREVMWPSLRNAAKALRQTQRNAAKALRQIQDWSRNGAKTFRASREVDGPCIG